MVNFFKDHKEHLFILAGGVLLGIIGTNIYNNSKTPAVGFNGWNNAIGKTAVNASSGTSAMTAQAKAKLCNQLVAQYNDARAAYNTAFAAYLANKNSTTEEAANNAILYMNGCAQEVNSNGCGNYPMSTYIVT